VQIARRFTLILLLVGGVVSPAVAQGPWSIFVAGGAAGFGGTSNPTGPVDAVSQYKPGATTRFHLGAARAFGRVSVAIDASYAKAGLNASSDGFQAVLSPAFTLYDFRLLANYELARMGTGTTLLVGLGPMLQIWSGDAVTDTQTRLGAVAALTLNVPISRRFGLFTTGSLGVAGSAFDQETLDLVGGFEPVATWTRELGVGIRYGL
jgi:hypothetical protein